MTAREHHIPLFHPRLVRDRIRNLNPTLFASHEETLAAWLDHLHTGMLNKTKETRLHGGFLERIFGELLGLSDERPSRFSD
jgi:hypothetical protein